MNTNEFSNAALRHAELGAFLASNPTGRSP